MKFFVPWEKKFVDSNDYQFIKQEKLHQYKNKNFHFYKTENFDWCNKPFFAVANENCVINGFLAAIKNCSIDEAKTYVSKNFVSSIDFEGLKNIFDSESEYKYLINLPFEDQKNKLTNSILVGGNKTNIVHVHMIHEPDRYGRWKIYNIEKE